MSVFDFTDYKTFLKSKIKENAKVFGYKGKLAAAANCQRAYLSQVFTSHVHLTPDHAAGLAVFWGLVGLERDFFMELVNLARAATPTLRNIIDERLKTIKSSGESVSGRIKKPKIDSVQFQLKYYSLWYYSAIHILLTVAKFRTPEALAGRLGLPMSVVMEALSVLAEAGLAKVDGKSWVPVSFDLHLPAQSPMTRNHHLNWRNRATQSAQETDSSSVHFTAIYSLSGRDLKKIRSRILEVISESREVAIASPEEDVYSFCCDLFRV